MFDCDVVGDDVDSSYCGDDGYLCYDDCGDVDDVEDGEDDDEDGVDYVSLLCLGCSWSSCGD